MKQNEENMTLSDLIDSCSELVLKNKDVTVNWDGMTHMATVKSGEHLVFTLHDEPKLKSEEIPEDVNVLCVFDTDVRQRPYEYVIRESNDEYMKILNLFSLCMKKCIEQEKIKENAQQANENARLNTCVQIIRKYIPIRKDIQKNRIFGFFARNRE